jgi:peptidoglycan/xylan/chitin deacetylase (PgdA/CDA1 family)
MINSDKAHQRRRRRQKERLVFAAIIAFVFIAVFVWKIPSTPEETVAIVVTATQTATLTQTPTITPALPTATIASVEETAVVLPTPTDEPTITPTHTPTIVPVTPRPTDVVFTAGTMPTAVSTATPLPLPTPYKTVSSTLQVPILMYHYISIPPADADSYRLGLSTSPDLFRQQMVYLAENDFTPIDLYDLSLAIAAKTTLPDKPIIITLDDGYVDNYENALPILQEFGFVATFFIATDFIDRNDYNYMSWEMIMELSFAGMRIEPHSMTHPDLRGFTVNANRYEMRGSRDRIEAFIGYEPRFFAYPSGQYDENSVQAAEELGFWGAVTTNGGTWHGFNDRYEWTRLRMRPDLRMEEFSEWVE